jgi:cyclopropane-fatty-acyl-phospholipid synthase
VTISDEQLELAAERVRAAGLEDRVTVRRADYRHVQGRYDRIVSIEMLEAVGDAYFGLYFRRCADCLKPGGRAVFQVITIPDERYARYRRNPDWIQKYIFPGGILPSPGKLSEAARAAGFAQEHGEDIGPHYAETLRRWREGFNARREELLRLGFDETFRRMWNYYLCYCEAGFENRHIGDHHLVYRLDTAAANPGRPPTAAAG